MNIGLIIIIILVIIILGVVVIYNKLITLRIDVQLKRRFDLIPNLVETVKGYAKHESETLENVIKARNTFLSANTKEAEIQADGELTKAISKLFALTESYPDLKANTNFVDLQNELQENKIASARQFYNDTVMVYNTKLEVVPSNFIASIFHFKKEAFFEANETERENVKVKF